jgi:hypothetical protein
MTEAKPAHTFTLGDSIWRSNSPTVAGQRHWQEKSRALNGFLRCAWTSRSAQRPVRKSSAATKG